MYRVTLSPKVDDLKKNPQNVNQWLKTIEGRFNTYSGAVDPVASEIPIGQWVFHRNTATNVTKIWTNWNGTLTSFGAGGVTSVTASAPLASSGGATPNITVANSTGSGTNLVTDNTATVTNIWAIGNLFVNQGAVTSKANNATITGAELINGILTYTGAGAGNITTPTATNINNVMPAQVANNMSFYWSIIATGAGAATVVANTGVNTVGSMVVAAGTSGWFLVRRATATPTFIVYRLS